MLKLSECLETTDYVFFCPPIPAPRARVGRWGSYYPASYKKWREEMAGIFKGSGMAFNYPDRYDLLVEIECVIPRPSKTVRLRPAGDWDNYAKSVCDALNAVLYHDDQQIVQGTTLKRWCRDDESPHVRVSIGVVRDHGSGCPGRKRAVSKVRSKRTRLKRR